MVLESSMICVDNSDFMRNGDFIPTRLQAQHDAVSLVAHTKTRSNPENNVGLLTMANSELLVTLTSDVGRILSKLHAVQPRGEINFTSAIRIAHLALKHRQGRNHKMRIVVFVGSPVEDEEKELVKLAKRLKKEKVNVDVVNFGEESINTDKLSVFLSTLNGKDGTSSHLVTVSPGPLLSDALISSPVIQGEDGVGAGVAAGMGAGGFEFGVDPNEDPDLALALRVSMEEQRARQEDQARKVQEETSVEAGTGGEGNEQQLLEQAIAMSMRPDSESSHSANVDFGSMTEEQQIAYAMQMSLQADAESEATETVAMETDDGENKKGDKDDEDFSEVMNDPAFLQSVLENLPGVDPQSEAIRNAMGSLAKQDDEKKDGKDTKKK